MNETALLGLKNETFHAVQTRTPKCVLACFAFYYSRLVCRFHVGSRIVSLFHPQRIAHLHLFKKKKTPSTVGRALSPFTSSYRVGPCEADASCTQPLSLSLSLLYTSKETWEHESVVLTTTCAHTQPVHTTHHHRKQVTSGSFQSSKKKKYIYHIAHTRCARRGREREPREGRRGEGGRSKKEKRTAATRIPAWSPTAVLTSRYRA